MLHRSAKALLARGLSTDIAKQLANEGYTLKRLKLMAKEELVHLGLTEDFIKKLKNEPRPPIPNETLNGLLHESRFCCCICRDDKRPVIIHHINPWESSHSHERDNLVVLCTHHHNEAHTRHDLSINLTPERIKKLKEDWIKDVESLDCNTILSIINSDSACWDYFNIFRLFELASFYDIDYKSLDNYGYLYTYGFIDENGFLRPVEYWKIDKKPKYHWLDFISGMYVNLYLKEIVEYLIAKLPIKILNDIWCKSKINSLVKSGDIIVVQGPFYFKDNTKLKTGEGQIRSGYRVAKGIRVEFTYDAFYSTSSSAKNVHLSGRKVATVFAIVREVKNEENLLTLRCTVLAIGNFFNSFENGRFFAPFGYEDYEDDEEYEDEFDGEDENVEVIDEPIF